MEEKSLVRQLDIEKWRIIFETITDIFERASSKNNKMNVRCMELVLAISQFLIPDLKKSPDKMFHEIFGNTVLSGVIGPMELSHTLKMKIHEVGQIKNALDYIAARIQAREDFKVEVIENALADLDSLTAETPWRKKDYAPDFRLKLIQT